MEMSTPQTQTAGTIFGTMQLASVGFGHTCSLFAFYFHHLQFPVLDCI